MRLHGDGQNGLVHCALPHQTPLIQLKGINCVHDLHDLVESFPTGHKVVTQCWSHDPHDSKSGNTALETTVCTSSLLLNHI
jgi:hypothetical protein